MWPPITYYMRALALSLSLRVGDREAIIESLRRFGGPAGDVAFIFYGPGGQNIGGDR